MVRATIPKYLQLLNSFLGLLNYYLKFFPIWPLRYKFELTATARIQLEMDSGMDLGFQSFQRS